MRALSLLAQGDALSHAKPVLFIGDDQSQPGEFDPGGDKRMGAHHQIHLTGSQSCPDAFFLRGLGGTGEQLHPQSDGGEEFLHGFPVLGGEDLSGRHQGRLGVVPGRKYAGAGGNHRLA